ncbi:MAG: alpha/beta fold hydrolase, partial [Paracoccaceae bacterium]
CPKSPYSMGALVRDIEALMDQFGLKNSLFIGLSIGGLIGQGLAVKRLDLIRALVLSNTGARIGNRQIWEERISKVKSSGMKGLTEQTMKRWFSKKFFESAELNIWKNMFERQPLEGYIGCSHAISGTDFYTPTSGLRLPTLGIAGSEDGSTPPDLVRETCELIPGSQFNLIKGVGHIPCVEAPEKYAKILSAFIKETGHGS